MILEVGADRILYSVDYAYEDVVEAKEWFDQAAISESDRLKIARAKRSEAVPSLGRNLQSSSRERSISGLFEC